MSISGGWGEGEAALVEGEDWAFTVAGICAMEPLPSVLMTTAAFTLSFSMRRRSAAKRTSTARARGMSAFSA